MNHLLLLASLLKLMADIALFSLIGQGLLRVLAGARRQENFVYRVFVVVTRPVFIVAGWLTPRFVAPRFHGLIAFLLLFWGWVGLIIAKCYFCVAGGGNCERGCHIVVAAFGFPL